MRRGAHLLQIHAKTPVGELAGNEYDLAILASQQARDVLSVRLLVRMVVYA